EGGGAEGVPRLKCGDDAAAVDVGSGATRQQQANAVDDGAAVEEEVVHASLEADDVGAEGQEAVAFEALKEGGGQQKVADGLGGNLHTAGTSWHVHGSPRVGARWVSARTSRLVVLWSTVAIMVGTSR